MGVDVNLAVGDSELPQVGIEFENFAVQIMCHRCFRVPFDVVPAVFPGLRLSGEQNHSVVTDSKWMFC